MADLLAAAGKGDPDGTANVTLRGQPIVWLSRPSNPGTLTQGPLRLWPVVPRETEVGHPPTQGPVHPFTGDPLPPRLAEQAWADGALTFFIDLGTDRFRANDSFVVQEVALFRFAVNAADG